MAETYYVDTINGNDDLGTNDGLTFADAWKSAAFAVASLGTGQNGTLTDHTTILCSGGEDAGELDINNSGSTYDLTIEANSGESDGWYQGEGFSTSHYYSSHTTSGIRCNHENNDLSVPLLLNIQYISKRTGTGRRCLDNRFGNTLQGVRLFNNEDAPNLGFDMARGTFSGFGILLGCFADMTRQLGGPTGSVGGSCFVVGTGTSARTNVVDNCTAIGGAKGLEIFSSSVAHTNTIRNMVISSCTDAISDENASSTEAGTNCAHEDTAESWETGHVTLAPTTDFEGADTTSDYRPTLDGTGQLDAGGTSASTAVTDVAGVAFEATPSIGAWEHVAAAGGVAPQYQHLRRQWSR